MKEARNFFFILIILIFIFLGGGCSGARPSTNSEDTRTDIRSDFVPDEFIVLFKKGTSTKRILEIHQSFDVQVLGSLLQGRINRIKIPKGKSSEELRKAYASLPEVESVEVDHDIRGLKGEP